jgi:uncharacterized linocin/CFP29 family protein
MPIDFVYNGQSSNSSIVDKLEAADWDAGALRPWLGEDGKSYVTLNRGGKPRVVPVRNANATLTKEAWLQLDTAILRVARNRLRAVADLRAAGLTFGIPNGMGTTVLEYQKMNDTGNAIISMDGLRQASDFRPVFESAYLPLPFIHSDFQYSARQLATSRQTAAPLDTTTGEMAGRRVAEMTERLTLGRLDTYTYGGGTIMGITNFTGRLTAVITDPTDSSWTPKIHLDEVLAMRQQLQDAKHYGPYTLYYSSAWDKYLDNDFNTAYPNKTLRNRIREIDGIQDVRTLDYLDTASSTYNMVMLEMDTGTIRLVIGMDVTTLEWDDMGGLRKNYKVMCIIIPQLRADMDGNTGVLHGAVT